jgi:hypothetical protein
MGAASRARCCLWGCPARLSPTQFLALSGNCPRGRISSKEFVFCSGDARRRVAKFTTGEVEEQVIAGLLRSAAVEKALRQGNALFSVIVTAFTYLTGAKNVDSTRAGIESAIGTVVRNRKGIPH